MSAATVVKRLLVGRPQPTYRMGESLLPKWVALPVFSSDPLSSVAYATEQILVALSVGGLAYYHLAGGVAAAVAVLLVVVVVSYRQVIYAYPGGGGSYEVVKQNIGSRSALVVAAALLVDYVMTVAVSVASGVDNVISAVPSLNGVRVPLSVALVAVLALVNLRGIKESGRLFALPTYGFVVGILLMIGLGLVRALFGHAPLAASSVYPINPEPGFAGPESTVGLLVVVALALRAFSSGCTALTGVEAISNGVPAFREPKARNASRTLLVMGLLAMMMFAGTTALALVAKVHIAENLCQLQGYPGDCANDPQQTVIAQLGTATFGGSSPLFYLVQAVTALILVLAANTAFNGFPMLGSILARDRYLPRQLHTRGDRLAFSNGILSLALVAGALLVIFQADVSRLIQLYILGVFTAFTLSQVGMVKHWLSLRADPTTPSRHTGALVVNATGAALTGLVLVIVTVTKFSHGAWLALLLMLGLYLIMRGISKHYARVQREVMDIDPERVTLPSRVHAVVLVSSLHAPTLRALSYARATRPTTIEAVTVAVDLEESRALVQRWASYKMAVPLRVLDSPYREITRPIMAHVRSLRAGAPRDLVAVYIPEYVVGHWWEQLLHNQSALRLKARLLFQTGVTVTSVPWQLPSSTLLQHPDDLAAGAPRTGAR